MSQGAYLYDYMHIRVKFNETSLLERKKKFCKNLTMEETTSANYQYLKNICKYFDMKILGEYQDSYALRNTLLLNDVFQSF